MRSALVEKFRWGTASHDEHSHSKSNIRCLDSNNITSANAIHYAQPNYYYCRVSSVWCLLYYYYAPCHDIEETLGFGKNLLASSTLCPTLRTRANIALRIIPHPTRRPLDRLRFSELISLWSGKNNVHPMSVPWPPHPLTCTQPI